MDLTQTELGEALKIHQSTVCSWETGTKSRFPSIADLATLLNYALASRKSDHAAAMLRSWLVDMTPGRDVGAEINWKEFTQIIVTIPSLPGTEPAGASLLAEDAPGSIAEWAADQADVNPNFRKLLETMCATMSAPATHAP